MSEEIQSSYDSIAAAAAGMGETVARLRWAKRKGAPGFRGSRVYPQELLPWLEGQEQAHSGADGTPIDKEGWEIRRLNRACELADIEIARKRGELWPSADVRASWLLHMRQARQVILQMATDLAPRIAGRPAVECEQLLKAAGDEALGKLRGNPYGEGECKCACGRVFDLVGVNSTPAAKGNEEPKSSSVVGGSGSDVPPQSSGAGVADQSVETKAQEGASQKGVGCNQGKVVPEQRQASAGKRAKGEVQRRARLRKKAPRKSRARRAA